MWGVIDFEVWLRSLSWSRIEFEHLFVGKNDTPFSAFSNCVNKSCFCNEVTFWTILYYDLLLKVSSEVVTTNY